MDNLKEDEILKKILFLKNQNSILENKLNILKKELYQSHHYNLRNQLKLINENNKYMNKSITEIILRLSIIEETLESIIDY